jgi:aminopeptidase N
VVWHVYFATAFAVPQLTFDLPDKGEAKLPSGVILKSNRFAQVPFVSMETPPTIHLKDYAPADFTVSHVELHVVLDPKATKVESCLHMKPRAGGMGQLILNGEELVLKSIAIDDRRLKAADYTYANNKLHILSPPLQPFRLKITQICNPEGNTSLSGLYLSNGTYCTQMEAEGFRRFAFMYDRPDVMATYTVRIDGPKNLPVLLSNGNAVSREPGIDHDRHVAEWHDPHPKPTYLFALVAGDLASVQDSFITSEGRKVSLGIYVEKGKQDRCAWAMDSLKASMRWDEERFGRAYDLDVFNIVAVSDFNMGAMENKGLNIFNDKYILARPDTATDTDYVNIERIIAHEYFHNWTGNRITCRDWFQLCLKEGLTVFRDQEFTSDLRSRAVKRIEDVKTLRARQFPEDAGPLAHAVRPSSYIEINNFYTPTVYEKGAEICRMLQTLLGRDGFRKGTDLFFERHDGEAATVEHFLTCMADASGRDLSQLSLWYEQAGTPVVTVTTDYNAETKTLTADFSQTIPDTPGQTHKHPMLVPLALGLLSPDGKELPLQVQGNTTLHDGVLELTDAQTTVVFHNLATRPTLSVNRGFSAPVILQSDATEADLLLQLAHDSDSFNRWEAAQTLARRLLVNAYHGEVAHVAAFADGLQKTLVSVELDDAFKSLMLQLPGEAEITATLKQDVDATRVHETRQQILANISERLHKDLSDTLDRTTSPDVYKPDTRGTSRRSLWLSALALLSHDDGAAAVELAADEFARSSNMTLEAGAISAVLKVQDPQVDEMLGQFLKRHAQDHLLVDKWFMMMAARPDPQPATRIETLTKHSVFNFKTPNRVYALIGGFTGGNPAGFHAADGTGYALLANIILILDGINPQVASRMATSFRSWKQYDVVRRGHAALNMKRILAGPGLSNDVYEIISRTLT